MSNIKLFRLSAGQASELRGRVSNYEKPLKTPTEQSPGLSSLNRQSKEKPHA